jgi:hypothetical protein
LDDNQEVLPRLDRGQSGPYDPDRMPLLALLMLACGAGDEAGPPSGYPPPPKALESRELPPPPNPPPAGPPDVGTRFLWGLGIRGGFGEVLSTVDTPLNGLPHSSDLLSSDLALYLRLGAELGDFWGVEAEAHGGILTSSAYAGGALTIDLTPVDWFTFAAGPLVDEDVSTSTTTAVGATVRFDFHLSASRTPAGRGAFNVGLAGNLAASLGEFGTEPTGGAYLTVGYAHY